MKENLTFDSIVSERALRELYLRSFELTVRSAQPMALMTSYNLINGVHTANSKDLVTKVLREEWGYKGLVMTDWSTTGEGSSCPVQCIQSGNDLIMPGTFEDIDLLRTALTNSTLSLHELRLCVARIIATIWQSREYESAVPYAKQFHQLSSFITSSTSK